jgi:hypothetical protein
MTDLHSWAFPDGKMNCLLHRFQFFNSSKLAKKGSQSLVPLKLGYKPRIICYWQNINILTPFYPSVIDPSQFAIPPISKSPPSLRQISSFYWLEISPFSPSFLVSPSRSNVFSGIILPIPTPIHELHPQLFGNNWLAKHHKLFHISSIHFHLSHFWVNPLSSICWRWRP